MFGSKEKAQKELANLEKKIDDLRGDIAELKVERQALQELTNYEKERERLKAQINDLEIGKSKLQEKNDRDRREVEHKIGLLKQKQDHDAEHAARMATLEVREANLEHEKNVFKEQMEFREKQFDQQFDTLQGLTSKILEHLPNVNYDITEDRTSGAKQIEAPKPATRSRTRRSTT